MSRWEVVERKAIFDDGTLFFPEKLTHEFLQMARETMGSYLFANQYMNEIIPSDAQSFKKEWFKYYQELPKRLNYFAFIDPALSETSSADYTGLVVIAVDVDGNRYVVFARRYKITPTEIVKLIFDVNRKYKPRAFGIEEVAYQKALLYFTAEEMKRRNEIVPIVGVRPPNDKTKQMKILELVPRFEWGHIYISQGLHDLEMELLTFPRGAHDDLIDALASMNTIIIAPERERVSDKPPHPSSPQYESWVIRQKQKGVRYADQD